MRLQRTYYEVLGLPKTASSQEIKAKYHELARKFHPDRAKDKVVAERLFVQINQAYRTLMDSNRRAVYDASLSAQDVSKKPANTPGQPSALRTAATSQAAAPMAQDGKGTVGLDVAMKKANDAYMSGDRTSAERWCESVIRAQPKNAQAHQLLGDVYADQGKRQQALDEYTAAAEAGGMTSLLQGKITRMRGFLGQTAQATAPTNGNRPVGASQSAADDSKKGTIIDRIIGRK